MEEYTPRGKPSYPLTLSLDSAVAYFQSLTENPLFAKVVNSLKEKTNIYLVGGVVRDALLGKNAHDIDLTCSLKPEEMKSVLLDQDLRVIDTGIEHGTITCLIGEDKGVEITTFRKPSKREETEYGSSIEEDLLGRDFTINAIAYDIGSSALIDPFDGITDLKNGMCRAVDNPNQRFQEDPLRILRMIRFSVAEGRTLEETTKEAAMQNAEKLAAVSPERIRNELLEIFTRNFPDEALKLMLKINAVKLLIPELIPTVGCEQNEFHIHDVFDHTAWVLGRSICDPIIRMASLFHDIGKPETLSIDENGRRHFYSHEHVGAEITKPILERLKFSKSDTKRIVRLVKEHMRPMHCGPAGVRRILRDLEEDFDLWLAIKRADAPPIMSEEEFKEQYSFFMQMVEEEYERTKEPSYGKLAVNGDDLLQLGLKEGRVLGELLKKLEEMVIEDPALNERDNLLSEARKFIEES